MLLLLVRLRHSLLHVESVLILRGLLLKWFDLSLTEDRRLTRVVLAAHLRDLTALSRTYAVALVV